LASMIAVTVVSNCSAIESSVSPGCTVYVRGAAVATGAAVGGIAVGGTAVGSGIAVVAAVGAAVAVWVAATVGGTLVAVSSGSTVAVSMAVAVTGALITKVGGAGDCSAGVVGTRGRNESSGAVTGSRMERLPICKLGMSPRASTSTLAITTPISSAAALYSCTGAKRGVSSRNTTAPRIGRTNANSSNVMIRAWGI